VGSTKTSPSLLRTTRMSSSLGFISCVTIHFRRGTFLFLTIEPSPIIQIIYLRLPLHAVHRLHRSLFHLVNPLLLRQFHFLYLFSSLLVWQQDVHFAPASLSLKKVDNQER